MQTFTLTRGINCRRYFSTTVEAETAEEAFAKGKALMHPDHANQWTPDATKSENHHSLGHVRDLSEPCTAGEESLAVDDEDGEPLVDFTDVPNDDEPASYPDLLAFARRMASMVDVPDVGLMDDDRIEGEMQTWREMIETARDLIKGRG